ncbi:MAG: MFS transporter [Victivallales bacterium]|nr:MFS transporter [Victivallales bacterium]
MSLRFGRYDYAAFAAFTAYAACSLIIPVALVQIAQSLQFPLESGGMGVGGALQISRSGAMIVTLLTSALIAGAIGKRLSMGFAMLMMGGGIFCCAFTPAAWFLFPCLLFAGLGEGICEALATPFVNDLHKDAPASYVNYSHAFWSVGIAICTVICGGLLALGVSWRILLGLVGLVTLTTSLGFLRRELPGYRYPESKERVSLIRILSQTSDIARTSRFWLYCLGMFLGSGAEFGLTFWSASFIQLHFHASAFVGGLGTAALAAGMFTSRTGFAKWLDENHLPHGLIATALLGVPASLALLFLPPALCGSSTLSLCLLFGIMFLCGFSIGPYWPSLQVYGVRHLPHLDSTLLYIYFSACGIPGAGFFSWLMGALGDFVGLERSLLLVPTTMGLFAILILFIAFLFPPKNPSHRRGR